MGVVLPESVLKLTEAYEMRVYWFEIVECFRKLALTGMPCQLCKVSTVVSLRKRILHNTASFLLVV